MINRPQTHSDSPARALSAEHLATLASQLPYGVAIFSRQSGIQLWNRWLVDKTGIAETEARSRQLVEIFPALADTPLKDRLQSHLLEGGDGFQWAEDSHRDQLALVARALGLDTQQGLSQLVCRAMFQGKGSLTWLEIIPREKAVRQNPGPSPLGVGGVKDRFPVYLESANQGIVTIDNYGFIQAINPRLAEMLGYTVAELVDKPVRLLFPSLSATSGNENYRVMAESLIRQDSDHLLAAVSVDGKPLNLEVQVVDAVGSSTQWTLCCRDVSSQKRLNESLLRQRQVISAIFSNTADAVLLLNRRGYLDNINAIGAEMLALGHRRHDNLHVDDVLNLQDGERSRLFPFAEAMSRERQVDFAEVSLALPGGGTVSVMVNAVPIRDQHNHGIGCMLVMRPISEARRISSRLSWHETHDPLTQLANRRQIENEVLWAIDDARAEDSTHGLLYIDLYNFSMINETCGHAAGDELLRQFAGLLSQSAGHRDVVARIGNDEFAVLLWRLQAEDIRARAEQILEQVTGFSLPWHERRLKVGASIGIEVISRDSTTEADALLSARASCGVAKEFGRNRIHFPVHGKEFLSRHSISQLATSISEALDEDRLVLYCQPIVSLNGGPDVKHYEVLVRMIERDGRLVSPGDFIPAAESSGLIDDVDKWVFDRVLDALAAMSAERRVKFAFSVNLSGYTVSDEKFLAHVIARLTAMQLEPGILQFEVTETAAVKHFDRAVDFINALNTFGCTFALDDFGIGLSSFAYLKQLPVNCLKIDGSFVRNMEVEDVDYSMVSTINHLAHVMGLTTIAECVENPTQAAMLREMGVDFGQGYYFAVPEPLEKILQEF